VENEARSVKNFFFSLQVENLWNVLLCCFVMGLIFGFALEKGQVYVPEVIRGQFLFFDNTMLKMFLSGSQPKLLLSFNPCYFFFTYI
jgi:hypothetical protein